MALTQGYQDYIQFAQTDESASGDIAELKGKRRRIALNAAKDIADARRENAKQQGALRHAAGASGVAVSSQADALDDAENAAWQEIYNIGKLAQEQSASISRKIGAAKRKKHFNVASGLADFAELGGSVRG